MTVIPRLFALYQQHGLQPITGHSSYHMHDWRDAPFTRFLSGNSLVGCAGLALSEVMFLEPLRDLIQPRNILVIGNAHGWSTVFLSLLFQEARVVAMDIDQGGIDLTNAIIATGGLNAVAVASRSPEHVALVQERHATGPYDLVLIDAIHTNEAIQQDYAAVLPVAAPNAVYLFHDVINLDMVEGFQTIARASGRASRVCTRTASGISVIFDAADAGLATYLDCFTDDPETYRAYRSHVQRINCDPLAVFDRAYGR